MEDCHALSGLEISSHDSYIVFINGKHSNSLNLIKICLKIQIIKGNIIGLIRDYQSFIKNLKLLRRKRYISEFVSMCVSHSHKCVYLSSDGGRLCRPYIIIEKGAPKLTQDHIDQLNKGEKQFEDFLKNGIIEYLDVNEESDAQIAVYEKEINK